MGKIISIVGLFVLHSIFGGKSVTYKIEKDRFDECIRDTFKDFRDLKDSNPPAGYWDGNLLYLDLGGSIIDLDFKISKEKKINGIFSIDLQNNELQIEGTIPQSFIDSLKKLKDPKPYEDYLRKEAAKAHLKYLEYHQEFPIFGKVYGDSIYFGVDTVYNANTSRHLRFWGKCVEYIDTKSFLGPTYSILGNYIDSAFQLFPAYGTFMLHMHRPY